MHFALVFILILFINILSFGLDTKKNILVIESYNSSNLWDKSYIEGLNSILGKQNNIEYFEMNTKQLPKSEHQKMAILAWRKYLSAKPDMVILGDDTALKYLGEKFGAEKIPVIYLGINNNPRYYFKTQNIPVNITGILERPILKRSFDYIKEILPHSKKALILFDTDITATIVKQEIYYSKNSFDILGINTDLKLINTFREWQNIVLSSNTKYDFIVLGLYHTIKDENGNYVKPEDVAKWTNENTKVPLFGFWDFSIGKDAAIGGFVLNGKSMGIQAGKMAQNILNKNEIHSVFFNEGEFLFSKFQLNKWKIKLPQEILKKARFID